MHVISHFGHEKTFFLTTAVKTNSKTGHIVAFRQMKQQTNLHEIQVQLILLHIRI